MIKKQIRTGVVILITGVIIVITNFVIDVELFNNGFCAGTGAALIAWGSAYVIRNMRIGRDPERAAEYEAALRDERNVYIAGRAGKMALLISAYTEILAGVIAILGFGSYAIGQVLLYAACFQCLLYYVIFAIYNKKC